MSKVTKQTEQRNYYPALRGLFGDWVYYSCLMSVREVVQRLSFATDIHKSERLSEWIQRQLKDGRSKEISEYLNNEKQRFFNSLVVAIYGGDPAWHGFSDFRPVARDINLTDVSADAENSVGFLSFTGHEKIFAVDGQHRLAGMKEAIESNSSLGEDDVSLLLVAHDKTKTGLERTRRLFTTLNKTAKAVGKGEIIALDENDVMAIVTRYFVENIPSFSDKRIRFSQTENLPTGASELTTIGNLYDVLTTLFVAYTEGKKKSELRFIRPADDEIQRYIALAQQFFDGLGKYFPPLGKYLKANTSAAAELAAKQRSGPGGHVLFRPIGLRLFSEVTAALVKAGQTLEEALRFMAKLPVELSKEPYENVIWLSNGRMNPGGRVVCRRLLLHILGHESDPSDLKDRLARIKGIPLSKVSLPRKVV